MKLFTLELGSVRVATISTGIPFLAQFGEEKGPCLHFWQTVEYGEYLDFDHELIASSDSSIIMLPAGYEDEDSTHLIWVKKASWQWHNDWYDVHSRLLPERESLDRSLLPEDVHEPFRDREWAIVAIDFLRQFRIAEILNITECAGKDPRPRTYYHLNTYYGTHFSRVYILLVQNELVKFPPQPEDWSAHFAEGQVNKDPSDRKDPWSLPAYFDLFFNSEHMTASGTIVEQDGEETFSIGEETFSVSV